MNEGDTFRFGSSAHLWVVVSDPAIDRHRVLVVNMTTDRGRDTSCILNLGDHPFVQHPTCMRYDKARLFKNEELDGFVSCGTIKLHEPVSAPVLRRIRDGAGKTDHLAFGLKQMLIDQGFIEEE